MFCKASAIGRLTATPKAFQSKVLVAKFCLAYTQGMQGDSGFINCVCFGKTAEFAMERLGKGMQVYVDGDLKHNKWDKDGNTSERHEISVGLLRILEKKEKLAYSDESFKPLSQNATESKYDDDADFGVPF